VAVAVVLAGNRAFADDYRDELDAANVAYGAKRFDKALGHAEAALGLRPESATARGLLVKSLLELGACSEISPHVPLLRGPEFIEAFELYRTACLYKGADVSNATRAYAAGAFAWARLVLGAYLRFEPDDSAALELAAMTACQLRDTAGIRAYVPRLRGESLRKARKTCAAHKIVLDAEKTPRRKR
jgi:hypothetical protein